MAALLSSYWEGLFQKYPVTGSLQRTAAFTLFTWQPNQSFVFMCKQPQVRFNVHQGQLHWIHLSIYSSLLDVHVCARIILLLLSGPAFWYDTFMIHFCSQFLWLHVKLWYITNQMETSLCVNLFIVDRSWNFEIKSRIQDYGLYNK